MNTKSNHQTFLEKIKAAAPWIAVVLVPLTVWTAWGFIGVTLMRQFYSVGEKELAALGQTGDIFGGVNALFAAFAFAGVAVAAFYQKQTAVLAREQLDRQAFEPLFFHLIDLHREIASRIRLFDCAGTRRSNPLDGRDAIDRFAKQMKAALAEKWVEVIRAEEPEQQRRLVTYRFLELYAVNESELGPYYRSLYHVFKLVDRARLPEGEKIEYANIARAGLGRDELFLLMLNGLTQSGSEFKTLIEKYGILKHLERLAGNGPSQGAIITEWLYKPTAWMSRDERAAYIASQAADKGKN